MVPEPDRVAEYLYRLLPRCTACCHGRPHDITRGEVITDLVQAIGHKDLAVRHLHQYRFDLLLCVGSMFMQVLIRIVEEMYIFNTHTKPGACIVRLLPATHCQVVLIQKAMMGMLSVRHEDNLDGNTKPRLEGNESTAPQRFIIRMRCEHHCWHHKLSG